MYGCLNIGGFGRGTERLPMVEGIRSDRLNPAENISLGREVCRACEAIF